MDLYFALLEKKGVGVGLFNFKMAKCKELLVERGRRRVAFSEFRMSFYLPLDGKCEKNRQIFKSNVCPIKNSRATCVKFVEFELGAH